MKNWMPSLVEMDVIVDPNALELFSHF